jgi:nucleotide-binding universal stress UspA family protein
MTDVIVPLDGSELALGALRTAAWLSEVDTIRIITAADDGEDMHDRKARLLEQARSVGVDKATVDVEAGAPAEVILAASHRNPEAMVVMATHGRSGLARAVLGSVAESVIRQIGAPLLLTGPRCDHRRSPAVGPVVLALDGSAQAEAGLEPAMAWCRRTGQSLVFVHVAPEWPGYLRQELSEETTTRIAEASRDYMAGVKRALPAGVDADVRIVVGNNVGRELIEVGEEVGAGLFVVASRARGSLSRFAVGSVAVHLAHHGTRPLLVITSQAGAMPISMDADG